MAINHVAQGLRLLANPNVRRMFIAYVVSYTGTAMAPIAMAFGVLEADRLCSGCCIRDCGYRRLDRRAAYRRRDRRSHLTQTDYGVSRSHGDDCTVHDRVAIYLWQRDGADWLR